MKNKSLIIVAVAFAAIMILAVALYPKLAEKANEATTEAAEITESTEAAQSTTKAEYPEYADIEIFDTKGNAVRLSDLEGKPMIINFWATWCGYCLYEMPYFEEAYKKYGDEIQFLMVNANDDFSDAREFIDEKDYTFPCYYDLEYSAYMTYGLSSLPRTVAIDAEGNMLYNRAGLISEETLQRIIDTIK